MAIRECPGLIMMDVQFPKMDGLEVTRRLRLMPAFNHIPMFALTAYAVKGDEEKRLSAGCDTYLSKPVSTRELPDRIAKMLVTRR